MFRDLRLAPGGVVFCFGFFTCGETSQANVQRFPPLSVCFDPSDTLLTAGWRGRGRRRARGAVLALCVREDTHGSRRKGLGEEELRRELKNQQIFCIRRKLIMRPNWNRTSFPAGSTFLFLFFGSCVQDLQLKHANDLHQPLKSMKTSCVHLFHWRVHKCVSVCVLSQAHNSTFTSVFCPHSEQPPFKIQRSDPQRKHISAPSSIFPAAAVAAAMPTPCTLGRTLPPHHFSSCRVAYSTSSAAPSSLYACRSRCLSAMASFSGSSEMLCSSAPSTWTSSRCSSARHLLACSKSCISEA